MNDQYLKCCCLVEYVPCLQNKYNFSRRSRGSKKGTKLDQCGLCPCIIVPAALPVQVFASIRLRVT